jgi:predicted nucleotidyltransferase
MEKADILALLHLDMNDIKSFGTASVGLFGSYAQEQSSSGSDIDILVTFETGKKNFDNYMELKFFLEQLFEGRSVDLVIAETLKPALRQNILDTVEYAT